MTTGEFFFLSPLFDFKVFPSKNPEVAQTEVSE
jgi:hypothetical protein